jgi:signal transduction histidine kinase
LELLSAIARVVGVAVENARLYQENVQQERLAAIGEATAGLGHCIKNILTGIRGGGEFVNMALEKKDLKYLERGWPILMRSIERIDNLVLNMLSFSKDRMPEKTLTDVNQIARDTVEMVRKRAEKSAIELAVDTDFSGTAVVDGRDIYRVVLNLVVNAVEACESKGGGKVTVQVRCAEDGCTIKVSDTGCGIPPEILPKLSQAFVSTKGSSGTGLGLACSYKIVREHGGRVDVTSEVGKGTSFTVFLPCEIKPGVPTQRVELSG